MEAWTGSIVRLLVAGSVLVGSEACIQGDLADPEHQGRVERIIAVAPSVAEILFELGLGERVVAVGDYVAWPPEATAKPRIGGLFDPRLEDIVALAPDLAVVLPSEDKLATELSRLGIEVLRVEHETLADLETAIESIARRAGVESRGRELVTRLRRSFDTGQNAPAEAKRAGGPRTVLVVAREEGRPAAMTVVGSRTFLAELLERAGARNVFGDLGQSYAEVGLEEMIRRQPEAIVELQPDALSAAAQSRLIADWQDFPDLKAVDQGCVGVIAGGHVLVPGPRLALLAKELEAVLERCEGAAR
ncbi:MAG: helical backbone metal receptor [Acidobacteriota bacterium]|nr:helical backbone metal receptor [Acidobacteriota bacterium]